MSNRIVFVCFVLLFLGSLTQVGIASIPLPDNPDWESSLSSPTQSIALGDVNLDGYLDLAVAVATSKAQVYLNINGTLESSPSWQSDEALGGHGITWVDIDRDGDWDLAVAHGSNLSTGPIKLYKNNYKETGGTSLLSTSPMWASTQNEFRWWLGFADINGDFKVDLVATSIGGMFTGKNEVYYGTGTTLPTTPSWEAATDRHNMCGSIGDANDDGLLDLAVAMGMETPPTPAMIHFNTGASLEDLPSWSSATIGNANAVAFAHCDGNNRVDLLICDNLIGWLHLDSSNTIKHGYSQTVSIADSNVWTNGCWGDVDTNGCLDFAIASNDKKGGAVQVFENSNGILTQGWAKTSSQRFWSVAWGDINRDGVVSCIDTLTGDGAMRLFYLKHYPAHSVDSSLVEGVLMHPAYEDFIFDPVAGWLWWTHTDGPIPPGAKVYVYYQYSKRLDLVVGVYNAPDRVYLNTMPSIGTEENQSSNLKPQIPKLEVYPNPFSISTVISYQLPTEAKVSLKVYDISGRLVKTLVDGSEKADYYSINLSAGSFGDADGISGGVYFLRLEADDKVITKKIVLMK
ncbi:MAG: T9SS type A sorting domain-containing protein [bacterium]|nr:T9SS type A sorting domain-containing protein [bacterium]